MATLNSRISGTPVLRRAIKHPPRMVHKKLKKL
jgi:hypothetical protein